jgi:hypothetical protein
VVGVVFQFNFIIKLKMASIVFIHKINLQNTMVVIS